MRNKVLVFAALLTIALTALVIQMRQGDRSDSLESHSLLSSQQMEELLALEQIQLRRGSNSVELARHDGAWGVVSRAGFPVQRERLAALLHAVRGARVIEEKTANALHHARLGLDPEAAGNDSFQIQLKTLSDTFGLIYGNQIGSGQLARFVGQDQVVLINRPLAMSVNPADWLALNVINIPMEQIASARWTHADGEVVELVKEKQGDYNMRLAGAQSAAGNERQINTMVLALVSFTAQDVALREELQLGEPILDMRVETWAGASLDASLYEQKGRYWLQVDQLDTPTDSSVAINADPRWAYQVGVGAVESLRTKQTELLQAP